MKNGRWCVQPVKHVLAPIAYRWYEDHRRNLGRLLEQSWQSERKQSWSPQLVSWCRQYQLRSLSPMDKSEANEVRSRKLEVCICFAFVLWWQTSKLILATSTYKLGTSWLLPLTLSRLFKKSAKISSVIFIPSISYWSKDMLYRLYTSATILHNPFLGS